MLTVRGARLVWDGAGGVLPDAEVAAGADGRVVARPVDGDVLDASGCVVTPGLVNAHHHLLQTAFRTVDRHGPQRSPSGASPRPVADAMITSPRS